MCCLDQVPNDVAPQELDKIIVDCIHGEDSEKVVQALALLYKSYCEWVKQTIARKGFMGDEASELESDVWFVILDKINSYEWRDRPLTYWIGSIIRLKALERYRNDKKSLNLTELGVEDRERYFDSFQHESLDSCMLLSRKTAVSESGTLTPGEQDQLIQMALSCLNEKEKQLIMLIYFNGLRNQREVANRLGMKHSTVRVYHKRAIAKMKIYFHQRRILLPTDMLTLDKDDA